MRKSDFRGKWLAGALAVAQDDRGHGRGAAPAPAPTPRRLRASRCGPNRIVDLMTQEAQPRSPRGRPWRSRSSRSHIPNARPEYRPPTISSPMREAARRLKWPTIEPKALSDRSAAAGVDDRESHQSDDPGEIGDFETAGAKAVFTVGIDDYAEVWINGQMPRRVGMPSPATIQGFNMPNRVVLADTVKAGDKFQIAVFGVNGPISVSPENFIFVRQAQVEFFR